jgi:nitrite reductase (NO-forming)
MSLSRAWFIPAALLLFTGCTVGASAPIVCDDCLAGAPRVPAPIGNRGPATVHVDLDATVVQTSLAPGVLYNAWTFNGSVPAPFIRARVGDTLDVTVSNSDKTGMPHNLDFHAVTGPGGGGAVTMVVPGQKQNAKFLLQHPGLFVYHCGMAPVMDHLANGMYGLLLVEPKDGLPKVDREYYVMQSEFYTGPVDPKTKIAPYSHEAGLREDPTYVVYNGATGALTGPGALTANTGETVRIFFGNAGPNKLSSFHIVGMIMDRVYREGDLVSPPAHDLQTTLVPAGGAAMIEVTATVPGSYALLDHAIFRTQKGAMGLLNVTGAMRPDIYGGSAQTYDPHHEMKH